MENGPVVAISITILMALLLVGVSVAISLATSGIIGLLVLSGLDITNSVIAGTSYTAVAKGSLIVVPMFVLMGMLTLHSGIAEQLFAIAGKLLKRIPGSLGMATVFASAGFGAISGSSLATVATMGRTCITEMMRHGYQRSFASATVAASGTLAVLIPPSIILVLYGVITGESIGALLIAGIVPGVLSALMLAGSIGLRAWRSPTLVNHDNRHELALATAEPAYASSSGARATDQAVSRDDWQDDVGVRLTFGSVTRAVLGVVVLFTVVIGGIYSGVFTPTESAAIGAFAAFVLICTQYASRPRLLRHQLVIALKETASLNSMIFLILVGAGIFSFFLVIAGVPTAISEFVVELPLPPTLIVILLLVVLIPSGMFLDSISLLVITVPLVYQPIMDLGFNGIWLGILVVKLIELGMITPPVGMNAYVAAGTTPGLEVEEVFKGLIPFYVADVAIVVAIFMIPALVTWLPNLSAA